MALVPGESPSRPLPLESCQGNLPGHRAFLRAQVIILELCNPEEASFACSALAAVGRAGMVGGAEAGSPGLQRGRVWGRGMVVLGLLEGVWLQDSSSSLVAFPQVVPGGPEADVLEMKSLKVHV